MLEADAVSDQAGFNASMTVSARCRLNGRREEPIGPPNFSRTLAHSAARSWQASATPTAYAAMSSLGAVVDGVSLGPPPPDHRPQRWSRRALARERGFYLIQGISSMPMKSPVRNKARARWRPKTIAQAASRGIRASETHRSRTSPSSAAPRGLARATRAAPETIASSIASLSACAANRAPSVRPNTPGEMRWRPSSR